MEVFRFTWVSNAKSQPSGGGQGSKASPKDFYIKRKVLIFPSSFVVISLSSRNNSGHANDRCEKAQASNNADDKQRNRLLYISENGCEFTRLSNSNARSGTG